MRKFTIKRDTGIYGVLRDIKIYVDGLCLGKIASGQTMEFELPDDARELYGKIDWGKTNILSTQTFESGTHLKLTAWFSVNPLRMLGIQPLPVKIEKVSHDPDEDVFE